MDTFKIAHDICNPLKTRSRDVIPNDQNVTFEDLMLSDKTLSGLNKCNFFKPSPPQLETIPIGRCGFDLVVQSKAGTGKTCIFTIVALEALKFNSHNSTQSLIVCPTREIAKQVHDVITKVGSSYEQLKCALCTGGVDVKQDRANLNKLDPDRKGSCQIVVGTPGRLKQLVELNILKTQHVELFVLDEADKLMDDQFKVQVDDIYKRLPRKKQMIATSATYPIELLVFLQKYMDSAIYKRIGEDLTLDAIDEYYVSCKAGHSGKKTLMLKLETVKKLLVKTVPFQKCFIFTNFQDRAPQICDNFNNDTSFSSQFGPSNYLSAGLEQSERNIIFTKFRQDPKRKILITTDVSARGIDIQEMDLVVNFDLPFDQLTYVHRIGRAGRFGQPGKAISIVSSESLDRNLYEKTVKSDRIKRLDLE